MQKRFLSLLRYGWPAMLILLLDVIAMIHLEQSEFFLPARFSIIVSILTLLAGWLPLVLQPSSQSRQAAVFATLLSTVLITPPPTQSINDAMLLPLDSFSNLQLWRILNSLAMLPVLLHLIGLFAENQKVLRSIVLLPLYGSPVLWFAAIELLKDNAALFWLRQIIMIWIVSLLILLLYILVGGIRNPHHKSPKEIQRLRSTLLVGILVMIPVFLRFAGLFFDIEIIPYEIFLTSLLILPLGVGYTVLRHNLFGIDELIRRAVGYTLLSVLASLVLFFIAVVTGSRAASRVPQFRWGSIFVALLFLAIFFTPLQRWLQGKIDRWFYPERYHFKTEVNEIQNEIMRVIQLPELITLLETGIPVRIGAKWASWVPGVVPQIPPHALVEKNWSTLLKVENEVLGGYWLAERVSGLPYSMEEQQQLTLLCQQAALAMAYARTLQQVEEINISLEKRVAERSAQVLEQKEALLVLTERRRIARDLHDSISQTLFSINLGARAIRKLAEKEPQTAMDELAVLEKSAQNAQQEMRSLLNELREPPQSEKTGTMDLIPELKSHFQFLSEQSGPDGHPPQLFVHYQGPEAVWLTYSQVEVLYQVSKEALHNIVKHAQVREAYVQISRSSESITLSIEDHGIGFTPALHIDTMGVRNMRTRLEKIGGTLDIEACVPQGSRIIGRIPWEEQT